MTSDDATPQADSLTVFFRDAPVWLSGTVFFLSYWGADALFGALGAAWGSRTFVWLLGRVAVLAAASVGAAAYVRAQSRSRRAASSPPAV